MLDNLDKTTTSRVEDKHQDHAPIIISFKGAGKSFGTFEATRDITLDIHQGEFVTLVGPSGCGKSTLLNMVAGIFAPTAGEVRYRGQPVKGFNRKVGYMTQSDHLLPWRTVFANVSIPLEIAGVERRARKARVEELLELVGLKGFGESYPSQLSGGMRKRCALARLLAYDPETLLFDEPLAALDAQLRIKMQVEIRAIAQKLNKTILFVTHDLDEAVSIADRCVVFSARPGTIQELVDIPLPKERDLFQLRHNPVYTALCASLWEQMIPSIHAEDPQS